MARDHQLLDVARDCLHFVTKFFEVIKVSAPHIYHSALELSPKSSIAREHYHHPLFRDPKPMVVHGLLNSWDQQPMAIGGRYGSTAWSPCGQYFSALSSTSVAVWDSLTMEKCLSLQLTTPNPNVSGLDGCNLLAYSPDGYSLAGYTSSLINIWDIQTGGVVGVIECGVPNVLPQTLVWLLDGKKISAIFKSAEEMAWIVCMYDVVSGVKVATRTFLSLCKPHIWPYINSLRVMTLLGSEGAGSIVNIFEVWLTLANLSVTRPTLANNPIESFPIDLNIRGVDIVSMSFSPDTYRISVVVEHSIAKNSNPPKISIFDISNSKVLLCENGPFYTSSLSPDGSLLITSWEDFTTYIWKYTSTQGYIRWRDFDHYGSSFYAPKTYVFSSASSSVLVSSSRSLEVWQLGDSPTGSRQGNFSWEYFSADATYVVTAPEFGSTITITNLYTTSSQLIHVGSEISTFTVTGNTLLVQIVGALIAWRLTAEGIVDGASGVRQADCSNCLWSKPLMMEGDLTFFIDGHIAVVKDSDGAICYNTETGEDLEPTSVKVTPPLPSWWKRLGNTTGLEYIEKFCSFEYTQFIECDDPSVYSPQAPIPWYGNGWVKCPKGEHQHWFWLPTHWRSGWDRDDRSYRREAYWVSDVTTLRFVTSSNGLVIIKF